MRHIIISLALTFSLSISTLYSQIETFKVLVESGESQIEIGKVKNPLERGMVLSGEFTLTVRENTYLGLVHNSGDILELREPGVYRASELYDMIQKDDQNIIVTKYTDFILDQDKEDAKRFSSKDLEAVRNFKPFNEDGEINLYIPKVTNLYGDKLAVEWADESESSEVKVMNLYNDILYEEQVQGQRFMLDLMVDELKDERILQVKVYQANGKQSKSVAIKRVEHEVRTMHEEKLKALTRDITNSALLELIKAAYFEDNKLLADAFTSYVNAMLHAPDVDSYREAYNKFLLRHNLLNL